MYVFENYEKCEQAVKIAKRVMKDYRVFMTNENLIDGKWALVMEENKFFFPYKASRFDIILRNIPFAEYEKMIKRYSN